MSQFNRIGLDTSKAVFTLHCVDEAGKPLLRINLRRAQNRPLDLPKTLVSEAARRIPPELQTTQPQIPWAQIKGVGNVLRHEYHRISDTVI